MKVARANFFPKLIITGGVGYEAFNTKYLFLTPESLIYNVAGDLVAPLINKKAIKADYINANARQLQAVYNYQRVILNAFTEVINRVSKVQNYSKSIEIKKQQLESLEASVDVASNLFQNARVEYMDVLFAQRDLMDARMVLIETKQQQLSAIVNAYQALGGGLMQKPPQCQGHPMSPLEVLLRPSRRRRRMIWRIQARSRQPQATYRRRGRDRPLWPSAMLLLLVAGERGWRPAVQAGVEDAPNEADVGTLPRVPERSLSPNAGQPQLRRRCRLRRSRDRGIRRSDAGRCNRIGSRRPRSRRDASSASARPR